MKLALVLHFGADIVRGSEVCLFRTIRSLVEVGFKVVLLRNNPVMDAQLPFTRDRSKLEVIDFAYPEIMFDKGNRSFPLLRYFNALKQLVAIIKTYKPEFLLCNSGLPCQLGVPAARLNGLKIGCHFHHPVPKRYLYLWLLPFVDYVFCPSKYTSKVVKEKCGKESSVVYNTVDFNSVFVPGEKPRSLKLRACHSIPQYSIVFGQVAALVPNKRPRWLLDAFAEVTKNVPNVHLLFLGKGSELNALKKHASALGIEDAVTFTGFVDSVVPYLQDVVDVNVLASEEEGLGISVIEASSCELPTIATDCTGLSEVVDHGITGLKFALNDKNGLVRSMTTLALNEKLRIKMGVTARQWSLSQFSEAQYKKGILDATNRLSKN